MSEELKPCPFCGGRDLSIDAWDVQPDNYHAARVVCNDCEMDGPSSLSLPEPDNCWMPDQSSAEDMGVKAWNRRAQPAEAEGPVQCPASHPAECYAAGTHVVHASLVQTIVRRVDQYHAALSAVTAERDAARNDLATVIGQRDGYANQVLRLETTVAAERDQLRAELETVKKVAYGNLELLDENAKLRAEVDPLLALLGKSLPVVEAHAGASHMLDGFRPIRNKWDELVDGIRAVMAAKEA